MEQTVENQFELNEANDLITLENNIKHILKEYSNKKMATHQVIRYLNEKKISKDWLASKKINSKDELEKYLNNLQNKVRSGIKESKKQTAKTARQDLILSEIERLAHEQDNDMQNKIEYTIGGL